MGVASVAAWCRAQCIVDWYIAHHICTMYLSKHLNIYLVFMFFCLCCIIILCTLLLLRYFIDLLNS